MNKQNLFSTGEFAKVMNTTKETLFHYDEIGLFTPKYKNQKGYRYYSVWQADTLEIIMMLRDFGLSLQEIKEHLNDQNPQSLLSLYDKEIAALEEKIRHWKQKSFWLTEEKKQLEQFLSTPPDQVTIRKHPDRYYFLAHTDSLDEKELTKQVGSLIERYSALNQPFGYKVAYIQFSYNIDKGNYSNYHDIALFLNQKPSCGNYEFLEKGLYLSTYYRGSWDNICQAYDRLLSYAKIHHYKLCDPFFEFSFSPKINIETDEDYITEISIHIESSL